MSRLTAHCREGARLAVRCVCLAVAAALLTGCCTKAFIVERPDTPPPDVMPTYSEVAERYNRHLEHLPRLWSRMSIDLTYHDENGKASRESVDGRLITVPPLRTVLVLTKLDIEQLFIGSNAEYYWVIDLFNKPKTVYFGRQENVGRPGTKPLPAPVHPRDLVYLLGIVEMPLTLPPDAVPTVGWSRSALTFTLPTAPVRMFVDSESFLPVRVELLDALGRTQIVSRLAEHAVVENEMEMLGLTGDPPRVATKGEITITRTGDVVQMKMSRQTTDEARVNPSVFDPEFLIEQVYEIAPENRVNLDGDLQAADN